MHEDTGHDMAVAIQSHGSGSDKPEGIWLATPLAEAITLAIAVAGTRIKKGPPLNLMRFCKK